MKCVDPNNCRQFLLCQPISQKPSKTVIEMNNASKSEQVRKKTEVKFETKTNETKIKQIRSIIHLFALHTTRHFLISIKRKDEEKNVISVNDMSF